ncbi:hypothetical protein BLOT_011234 [Blomia tropicalis]|nr:hypothetical protein BLOT_011234 [Blomia tropicalis]
MREHLSHSNITEIDQEHYRNQFMDILSDRIKYYDEILMDDVVGRQMAQQQLPPPPPPPSQTN